MKKALITGITGQDGSYLAEFLLKKDYKVHGIVRRSSTFNRGRIDHLRSFDEYNADVWKNMLMYYGDLSDSNSIEKIVKEVQPDEVYNLGAQSHVKVSFDIPEYTSDVTGLGTLRILEAIKNSYPNARFYQASSSEMFGDSKEIPQNEKTPFEPMSPYACAKEYAYNITKTYRKSYGLHASNGILFNHESEIRGEPFVTRKITRSLSRIKLGLQHSFALGNLEAKRDWGHAKDLVKAMWMIVQQDKPDDYVISTGESHSVREFLEESARCMNLNIKSNGKSGLDEEYIDENNNVILRIHPRYFRPSEVNFLQGNSEKARIKLGWEPKIKFKELIKMMVEHDLKIAQQEFYLNERLKKDSLK